ncbi:beta-ketoacyl synthase N-terminal-like domain-containing protein [Alkalimarinus alittae]|uniref:3-oxoacyl-[acyl-carrier-protein] synthase 1 n=1 Tax=Alkalimarinus alittae TaxID=2961619 RepID=A0ABY6MZ35_9ALTE|nr:beta-ketoacyl synthase N-terminal-like domain-containing protein [Alkalimarinus alittae]UZE95070.1 beta-ketoacyl-ACP synthase I [Alkalimarinus alittae]
MKRAVITGIGIISSLGNNCSDVSKSLKQGLSGITRDQVFVEKALRSQVSGQISLCPKEMIDRKLYRFMTESSGYGYLAMAQAIADAKLDDCLVKNDMTGLVMGTGGTSTADIIDSVEAYYKGGVRKVGPYRVTRGMNSALSSVLATAFGIRGINYSVTSACATSAHCIGNAVEQIQLGKQNIVFAGGADSGHWTLALQFDAMGALSTHYNDTPESASRPYDKGRDGFVIASGAGVVVVEELEHALARGAHIYGEVIGYAATSDGKDMVQPSGEGAERCMKLAISQAGDRRVQYINTHGTSTPMGDLTELKAIKAVFGEQIPKISATKSLSGHSLGAAGVHEAIYSLIMMQEGFIAGTANLNDPEDEAITMPIVSQAEEVDLGVVMSNSFGFGGTNASLIFAAY